MIFPEKDHNSKRGAIRILPPRFFIIPSIHLWVTAHQWRRALENQSLSTRWLWRVTSLASARLGCANSVEVDRFRQVMDNAFYALSGKWLKSTSTKGGLKSLGFVKPKIQAGVKHASLNEDKILPTNLGVLEISVRVIGELTSCQRLQCYIKFEWGIHS